MQDLQRRCRYLSHVPLGCTVLFCEIDWDRPVSVGLAREDSSCISSINDEWDPLVLSSEHVKPFADELSARKRRRENRRKKEDRAQKTLEHRFNDTAWNSNTQDNDRNRSPVFDAELDWHPLPTTMNSTTTPPSAPSPSAPTFANVTGKTVDELLHERLEQHRHNPAQTGKGRQKKKIILMSTGGRRNP